MNRFEQIKTGLELDVIAHRLVTYAKEGWESISNDDVERLKVHGIALRKKQPGYFMIRVRIPGGHLTSNQAQTLAEIADRYGRGQIDLTSRGQAQLRWQRIEHIPEVLAALRDANLSTVQTLMDSVRGIVGCPMAGLSPHELFDATPVIEAINNRLAGDQRIVNLPRKLNVAVTGCTHRCCHADWQDVALVPAVYECHDNAVHGFNVLLGGKMSGGDCHPARPLDLFVTREQTPMVVRAIAEVYRDHGSRQSRAKSRIVHLLLERGWDWMRTQVEEKTGEVYPHAGIDRRDAVPCNCTGVLEQDSPDHVAVGLFVPKGRLTSYQLRELAEIANDFGDRHLRLTTEQNVLLPNIATPHLKTLLNHPLLNELPCNPHPIEAGSVSCTGIAQCSLALIDSKHHASAIARELARRVPDAPPLRIHWSACRAGCGRHAIADIGLVGRKTMENGRVVEAADVYIGGSTGPRPVAAIKVLDAVPCRHLADALEPLIRYSAFDIVRKQIALHTREPRASATELSLNQHGVEPLRLQMISIEGREAVAL